MKFGKIINYSITIEPSANNGFFVTVGCGRFAYSNSSELLEDLRAYLAEPEQFEEEYNGSNAASLVERTRDEPRPERSERQEGN